MSADKTKIRDYRQGHRKRLRERVLADPHQAAGYELLEILLGYVHLRKDTKPLAKELLDRFGNLAGVLDAHVAERAEVQGLGESSEQFFLLLRELIARYVEENARARKSVTIDDIGQLARCRLSGIFREEVWVALLDNGNRLLTFTRVTIGTMNQVYVSPRDVVELALKHKAASLVLVHNHPGGNTKPSPLDVEMTSHIAKAINSVGLRFLDHLILADGKYYSLTRDRLLA